MTRLPLAALLLGVSMTAHAADLPLRGSIQTFDPPPSAFTWTGFYLGLNVGAAAAGDFRAETFAPLPQAEFRTSLGGFTGGGTLGYNYQFTPGSGFVVGIEVDGGYADLHNRTSFGLPGYRFQASGGLDTDSYFVSLRGRAGYAFGPMLAYATGGWSATEVGFSGSVTVPSVGHFKGYDGAYAKSMPIDGYTVGAGLEYAVMRNVSVKAEYLYADLDRTMHQYYHGVPLHFSGGLDVHQVRIGANYRFDGFPGGVLGL
ncbi:outer membrane protein [uncultured Methylobacterium sp.]|uniref:outer membrane protein n=1 Tax=uncultured Methylobacterium sp. TaxID=157278 RepID=UPI0035CB5484